VEEESAAPRPVISARLLGASLLAGIGGGAFGALYLLLLHLLQHALWPTRWGSVAQIVVLTLTGVGVLVITRVLGTPGNVELLVDNIHVSGGATSVRTLRSLVPMSLLTIAAGAPAGPEAPLATTNGSLASRGAILRRMNVSDTRGVAIAGMAAAFAVLFGAPVGSAFFALEILHRRGLQYTEALVPSIAGALSGYLCWVLVTHAGLAPIWHIPLVGRLQKTDFLWAAAAGVGGAIVAIAFTYLTVAMRRVVSVIPKNARPVVAGLLLGLLALWSSYALTFGEAQTDHVLTHGATIAVGTLIVAIIAKLVGNALVLGSGWPGGLIIPLFFTGAALGVLSNDAFSNARSGIMCAAFMAAAVVGVTKTLLGSTLVVTEMGGIRLFPTTMIAALIAFLLTSRVGLIETQRERAPIEDQ
jgi:H+/Cl- antiporter ClcA